MCRKMAERGQTQREAAGAGGEVICWMMLQYVQSKYCVYTFCFFKKNPLPIREKVYVNIPPEVRIYIHIHAAVACFTLKARLFSMC